jgi:ElaB/YqjD/DUF883 family membrane-anchored ribosome-binding protein
LEEAHVQREKDLSDALARLSALEADKHEVEEAKAKLEQSLKEEIARLKEDKDEQSKAVQEKFLALTEKLDKLDKPWWKKILGG